MIKTLWVNFNDDFQIDCFCDGGKNCPKDGNPQCKEYVVKFTEIIRSDIEDILSIDIKKEMDILNLSQKELKKHYRESKKLVSNLEKGLKKIKFKV